MIQINQLKLPINHKQSALEEKIRKLLKIKKSDTFTYEIKKRSIDARKKPDLYYVYQIWVSLPNEKSYLAKAKSPLIQEAKKKIYGFIKPGKEPMVHRPVIVGAGPAGLFCAYLLTEMGYCPIVLERGKEISKRKQDIDHFWKTGILNEESNVSFGEGGAGTFSDGKLNTVVKDPSGRNQFILELFVKYGAPESILFEQKPHLGTDILERVITNLRKDLIRRGCEFHFESKVLSFALSEGKLTGVCCADRTYDTNVAVLSIGHSARDTFLELFKLGFSMESKNFAVGFRVEHPQIMIDQAMYGNSPEYRLPAAPYKVTSNFPNGRGVYSFCMCPGGYVVNASSGDNQTVVNGMSYSGRNGKNANSAIIISVTPKDFGNEDVLAGMYYQIELEKKAFQLGNGKIPQQLYGDFCQNVCSSSYGSFASETKGQTTFSNLRGLFSKDMELSFCMGMEHFSHIIPDFDRKDAILSGVESRTSSPIRILRNENMESNQKGIYPCGEGAGYAGGIMSAAMDGLKVAEAIIRRYSPND